MGRKPNNRILRQNYLKLEFRDSHRQIINIIYHRHFVLNYFISIYGFIHTVATF